MGGRKRLALIVMLVLAAGGVAVVYTLYRLVDRPAVTVRDSGAFYISTGWREIEVLDALEQRGFIHRRNLVEFIFRQKGYTGSLVVPGKYTLKHGMSYNDLANFLRAGNGEEEVKVTFNNVRTLQELAGKVAIHIEADSAALVTAFTDPEVQQRYGLGNAVFISMFLPDTYFMEWDTDAGEFLERMAAEYRKFWNDERKARAKALGLSQSEVATLASIVQAEQQTFPDERPIIAGLYLNRLRKGMKLQSDPTVVYALGDFSVNRVLTKHLTIDSPYNTYIYAGLPPGPINLPSKKSLEAVLNPDANNYIYMCAKADFSGRHAFASTLAEHNRNAAAFRKEMDRRKIFR